MSACVQICITSPLMLGLRIVQTLGFKLTSPQQKGLRIDRLQRNEWIFFQFEYARIRLPFGIVNNNRSCLLHFNPT